MGFMMNIFKKLFNVDRIIRFELCHGFRSLYILQHLEGSFLSPAGDLHPTVPFTTICVSNVLLFVSY